MKPHRKSHTRPVPPDLITRRQMHELVGKSIADFLLREPNREHYHESTVEWIISEVMGYIQDEPYY